MTNSTTPAPERMQGDLHSEWDRHRGRLDAWADAIGEADEAGRASARDGFQGALREADVFVRSLAEARGAVPAGIMGYAEFTKLQQDGDVACERLRRSWDEYRAAAPRPPAVGTEHDGGSHGNAG